MSTSVSISHPVSSPQSAKFIITLTFSLPFAAVALDALISLPDGLPFLDSSIWLLFPCTSLSPAFCLSKGRLLVPYQTFMNYERPLSSGPDRKPISLSVRLSAEAAKKGEVPQSSQKHFVLSTSGMNYLSCCDPSYPRLKLVYDAHGSAIHLPNLSSNTPQVLSLEKPCHH